MNNPVTVKQFLGRGWPMPIFPDLNDSGIHYVEGADKIRQAIWTILCTEPGERLMRPDFGCGLRKFLMKPNTSATRALIKRDVKRSLAAWEPRINIGDVTVESGDDPAAIFVYIRYTHKRDGSPENLVFNFSLEP